MTDQNSVRTPVDAYILSFPPNVANKLQEVRSTIRRAAPEAVETIKYGIPTFIQNGILVHFGGFKAHIGFYPTPSAIEAFQSELANYKGAKGSIQFPIDQPMPHSLIAKMVKFRLKQNLSKH